jgi:hypothetical protein
MEHSLKNENRISETCDVVMNELNVMEENNVEFFSINSSLKSKLEKIWKLKMKK